MTINITLAVAADLCAAAPNGLTRADALKFFIQKVEAGALVATYEPKPKTMSFIAIVGQRDDAFPPELEINGKSEADPVDLCRVLELEGVEPPLELIMRIFPKEQRRPFLSSEVGAVAEASDARAEAKRQTILGDLIGALTENRPGLLNGNKPNVSTLAELAQKRHLARLMLKDESELSKGYSLSHIRSVISGVLKAVDSSDD